FRPKIHHDRGFGIEHVGLKALIGDFDGRHVILWGACGLNWNVGTRHLAVKLPGPPIYSGAKPLQRWRFLRPTGCLEAASGASHRSRPRRNRFSFRDRFSARPLGTAPSAFDTHAVSLPRSQARDGWF